MKQPLIYIIDPNQNYRRVLESCLNALDFKRLRLFENGESCFSLVGSAPDIIILEYNLGENCWNGIEFMAEFSRVNTETRYIFMSSATNVDIAVESIRKGASDYILKSKSGITRLAQQVEKLNSQYLEKQNESRQWNLLITSFAISTSATIACTLLYSLI